MRKLFTLVLIVFACNLQAQDDSYHTGLKNLLQTKYGITGGTWVFTPNEAVNANNTAGGGGTKSVIDISGQSFTKAVQLAIGTVPANGWNAGLDLTSNESVANGDRLLLIFWARTISGPGNVGMGNFEFMQKASPYSKYITFEQRIGTAWKLYILPFQVSADLPAASAKFTVELGVAIQTIQVAGVNVLNYGQAYPLASLPVASNDEYEGMEPGAAWRAAADARIEQYRKANLEIAVLNSANVPISNAQVKIEMLRHEYAFGTAINETKIAGNKNQDNTYQDKLFNLDGKGHGFSEVVFENGHKWASWDGNWSLTKAQKAATVKWLADRGMRTRGHTLVWPGWSNSPTDLKDHATDLVYLKNRIDTHLDDILNFTNMRGLVNEWDVVNEPTGNVDIANAFKGSAGYTTGREIYVDIFKKVKQIAPEVKKYINEANYTNFYAKNDLYKSYVQEIVNGGATIDGVGFQAHFRYMIPPLEWYAIYDEWHQITGGKLKITEYDTKTYAPDTLEAAYLRDLLTITFSHPHSDGFLMWGFWDGAHYSSRAPLFDKNWNLKKGGKPFIDLVFDKWWTPTNTLTSNADGKVTARGFKGTYKITITNGTEQFIDTIKMAADLKLRYKQPFTHGTDITSVKNIKAEKFSLYPNPASEKFTIVRSVDGNCVIRLLDLNSRVLKSFPAEGQSILVETYGLIPGIYFVEINDGKTIGREKLVIK